MHFEPMGAELKRDQGKCGFQWRDVVRCDGQGC